MDKWTDVRYGLPERGVSVLCYCKHSSTGGRTVTIGSYANNNDVWTLQGSVGEQHFTHWYWKVTHWMPLPKIPIPSLRFCPKCGFAAVYDEYQQDGVRVRCTHCEHKTEFYNDIIEASDDWNTQ